MKNENILLDLESAMPEAYRIARAFAVQKRDHEADHESVAMDAVAELFGAQDWSGTVERDALVASIRRLHRLADGQDERKSDSLDSLVASGWEREVDTLVLSGDEVEAAYASVALIHGATLQYANMAGEADRATLTLVTGTGDVLEGDEALIGARTLQHESDNAERVGPDNAARGATNHGKAGERDLVLLEVGATLSGEAAAAEMTRRGYPMNAGGFYTAFHRATKRASGLSGRVAFGKIADLDRKRKPHRG